MLSRAFQVGYGFQGTLHKGICQRGWKFGPWPVCQAVCLWSNVCPEIHLLLIWLKLSYGMAGACLVLIHGVLSQPPLADSSSALLGSVLAAGRMPSLEDQLLSCLLGHGQSLQTGYGQSFLLSTFHPKPHFHCFRERKLLVADSLHQRAVFLWVFRPEAYGTLNVHVLCFTLWKLVF